MKQSSVLLAIQPHRMQSAVHITDNCIMAGCKGVALGYSQLTDRDIEDLPIPQLQTDGFLFVWVINAKYKFTLDLFERWGYTCVHSHLQHLCISKSLLHAGRARRKCPQDSVFYLAGMMCHHLDVNIDTMCLGLLWAFLRMLLLAVLLHVCISCLLTVPCSCMHVGGREGRYVRI